MTFVPSVRRHTKLSSKDDKATLENLQSEYRAAVHRQWEDSIPAVYANTKLNRIPSTAASTAAQDYWKREDDARGLGFVGPTGVGKTRAALHSLHSELLAYGPIIGELTTYAEPDYVATIESPTIAVVSCGSELTRTVRAASDFKDITKSKERLERLRTANFLVLDDIGVAKLGEGVAEVIYDIVEHRVARGWPIVFTTNFSGHQLAARFADDHVGAAVVRRLTEFCEVITC